VIYVSTSEENRKARANLRNGDSSTWAKRTEDENAQFDEFEHDKPWDAIVCNNGEVDEAKTAFVEAVKSIIE
jgi:dephospho-CoA kinase